VVGAGALDGYFDGRLPGAGHDATYLVQRGRTAQLARNGLVIVSPRGDVRLTAPLTISADNLNTPFDRVPPSCKARDLDAAMNDIGAAVGPPSCRC
jgi:2-dehydropantoate 2-reductase